MPLYRNVSQYGLLVTNKGANNVEVTDVDGTLIPEGYYNGGSAVLSSAEAAKVIAENIKDGITLLGVLGTHTGASVLTGDALVGEVLDGKFFYKDDPDTKLEGTMPNIGQESTDISAKATEVTISAGYHDGTGVVKIHADEQAKIIEGNIKSGITILGQAGSANVVDTSSGDAVAGEILTGKKAYVDGAEVTGTMADKEGDNVASSSSVDGTTLKLVAPTGFYDGTDTVTITDADFVAANIKDTVNIFGVVGTYAAGGSVLTGDAIAAEVLDGKFFYSNDPDVKLEGTMVNNAGDTAAVSTHAGAATEIHAVASVGFYDGSDDAVVLTDANFVAANIADGVTIFGVEGTLAGSSVLTGDAVVGEVLDGKFFYSDDPETKLEGTMPNNAANNVEVTDVDGTVIPAGYYNGSGSAVLSAAEAAKVVAGNIKSGITLLGVAGNSNVVDTSGGNTIASQLLSGRIAYSDGNEITGTMPEKAGNFACSSSSISDTTLLLIAPEGYYSGDDNVTITDADFVAAKILSGVTLFGLAGTATDTGDAVAKEILLGKKAWVDGAEVTGTLDVESVTNVLTNSNFTSTTGWTGNGANISAASNIMTSIATTGGGGCIQTQAIVDTYKYYICGYAKADGADHARISVQKNTPDYNYFGSVSNTLTDTFEFLSVVFTATESTNVAFNMYDNRTTGNTGTNYFKYVMMIDLTTSFGAGNEPSKADMDEWIAAAINFSTNNWFSGSTRLLVW